MAGAKALLPGQCAEEGVLRPPPEQHGAAVEGELGLLRDGREGWEWAAAPRKLQRARPSWAPRLLPAAFRVHPESTRLPGQHHGPAGLMPDKELCLREALA